MSTQREANDQRLSAAFEEIARLRSALVERATTAAAPPPQAERVSLTATVPPPTFAFVPVALPGPAAHIAPTDHRPPLAGGNPRPMAEGNLTSWRRWWGWGGGGGGGARAARPIPQAALGATPTLTQAVRAVGDDGDDLDDQPNLRGTPSLGTVLGHLTAPQGQGSRHHQVDCLAHRHTLSRMANCGVRRGSICLRNA